MTLPHSDMAPNAPAKFGGCSVWASLEERVVPTGAQSVFEISQFGPIQSCNHVDARRYPNLHERTGTCYRHTRDGGVPLHLEDAAQHAFRQGGVVCD